MKTTWSLWLVAALFLIGGVGALYLFVTYAEPPERQPGARYAHNYSDAPLAAPLSAAQFQTRMAALQAAGMPAGSRRIGRLSGSPGFYRTEQLVTQTFQHAGLQVTTQEYPVVVPMTEYCEILDAHGRPLPDVQLYPVEPSGMLPTALPAGGLTGELVVAESSDPLDLTGKPLEGSIVLNKGLDVSWPLLASMGAKAVIACEDALDAPADPDGTRAWKALATSYDVNYPRFFARGPLDHYRGQRLTLRCKVTWQEKRVRNIIGVLHGAPSAREALIVNSYYDSYSIVPDCAPGGEQAISLAAMLQLVEAFSPYRGQLKRDVIFIASAGHGQAWAGAFTLMDALETITKKYRSSQKFETLIARERAKLAYVTKARAILDDEAPWRPIKNVAYRQTWQREDPAFRAWFQRAFATVAGEVDLERKEDYLAARLTWIRAGRPTLRTDSPAGILRAAGTAPGNYHPLMQAYIDAKLLDTRAGHVISAPFWTAAFSLAPTPERPVDDFHAWGYREKLRRHLDALESYHRDQVKTLSDKLAVQRLFARYDSTLGINLELYSGGANRLKNLAVLTGVWTPGTIVEPQSHELKDALADQVPLSGEDPDFQVTTWGTADVTGTPSDPNIQTMGYNSGMDSEVWTRCGRLAFTIVNKQFYPARLGTPEDRFEGISTDVLGAQLPVIGKALLAIAYGRVTFKNITSLASAPDYIPCKGAVLTTAGDASVVPSHRVGVNTFVMISGGMAAVPSTRGIFTNTLVKVNPYGEYEKKFVPLLGWGTVTVDGARFAPDGTLAYFKDLSPGSQALAKNEAAAAPQRSMDGGSAKQNINVLLFRCTELACYQRVNPKTLQAFARMDILDTITQQPPEEIHVHSGAETTTPGPAFTAFLPPETTFDLALLDGSAGNPYIQTYRAFLLNDTGLPSNIPVSEPELYGRGFLAADTPNLTFPYFDAAASVLRTNAKRLRLLQHYHMADEQMAESQRQGAMWLAQAQALRRQGEPLSAVNAASKSLSYAINNHPVIREKLSNAIVGILWYLGILIPFVFFGEKLLFGFTDVRKQLIAVGSVFIVVFLLLQQFHPAFKMVSAPLVILLGFLILLVALVVTVMISGKFMQVVRSLRRREGYVEGADVNRGGVIGTAFMLGLNNMRRRKVRTGLTCMTLVLITFMMICFTSVTTDLTSVEYLTGRAPSSGIMRRDPNFLPLSDNEINIIRQYYGLEFPVSVQYWLVGGASQSTSMAMDWTVKKNTNLYLDRAYTVGGQAVSKRDKVNAAITMPWNEPMFTGIDRYLLTTRGWFPRPPDTPQALAAVTAHGYTPVNYVMLPDVVAKDLGITVDDVNHGMPTVTIRNETFRVLGIFDSVKLDSLRGMDGQSMLPYDLNSMQHQQTQSTSADSGSRQMERPRDIARLKAYQVILTSKAPALDPAGTEQNIAVFCSVLFPSTPYQLRSDLPLLPPVDYQRQHLVVEEYLERLGVGAYYAVGGVAYYGYRTRKRTATGLIALLIPILIAAMTVFNTMRSSVHERKDEIYVYNAVGIAPNHVFFMFMAESCVYAVIGSLLGYLLSQISGTILSALGLTGGLNMDYSSIETIYASLAIVASVLLSALMPARTASRLALPSDETSWSVPKAEGDVMQFSLPFTFTRHDRVAVLGYFHRWLDANGAGSSGPFYCAPPTVRLDEGEDEDGRPCVIPGIETTIWLKPFDLGVSQRLRITLPIDLETHEYIARITIERLGGSGSAWTRAVKPFLGVLRKQFLNWRAVSDEERVEMFGEAKNLLTSHNEAARETVPV